MDVIKAVGNFRTNQFRRENFAAEESKTERAGGRIFKLKGSPKEFGDMILVYDAERNIFGVHSGN